MSDVAAGTASTSASTYAGLHRSRLYKGVETRALGDSQQTSVREGSSLWTRKPRGDLVLGVSNLVVYCPIQGGTEPYSVSHSVFLLREVVL